MQHQFETRITQKNDYRNRILCSCAMLFLLASSPAWPQTSEREQFLDAWTAASRGDRDAFTRLPQDLQQYELYPYLVYENMRHERSRVAPAQMASFLEQHQDWAFTSGLRLAWLKTLGRQGRWPELVQYADWLARYHSSMLPGQGPDRDRTDR